MRELTLLTKSKAFPQHLHHPNHPVSWEPLPWFSIIRHAFLSLVGWPLLSSAQHRLPHIEF